MLHDFLEILKIVLDLLHRIKDHVLDAALALGGLSAFGATLIFSKHQIPPSIRLLRQGLRSKKATPWPVVAKELFFCATKILNTHSLYKAVRLRVESEILSPPPVREYHPDRYRRRISDRKYKLRRREWRLKLNKQLNDLTYRSAHEDPTILLENSFALYRAEEDIANYLRLVYHDSGAPLAKAQRGRFLCQTAIRDGYLMPLQLVKGLLAHFEKDWKPILDDYERASPEGQPTLHRFLMDTWLLWGPSIPLCGCGLWQGGIAFQFGYGDETNSIPVFIRSAQREAVVKRLAEAHSAPQPKNPDGPALGSRVKLLAVPVWSESLEDQEVARAQASLRDPGKTGLLLEYVGHEEKTSSEVPDAIGYYSAYVWIMLEVTKSSRWPKGSSVPAEPWKRLIPVFEHANLFDRGAYDFMKRQLAEKTVRFVRYARTLDPDFECRFAFAFDETGCLSPPLLPFPGPSLRDLVWQRMEPRENARLQGCFKMAPDPKHAAVSSCRLPGWVDRLEKELSSAAAGEPEFERHEFSGGPDGKLLRSLYRNLYEKEFPDPDERESLENIRDYLMKKREGWYGRNNYHVLAMLESGNPVAVSICDYLEDPEAGVIEFLAVDPEWRNRGLGADMLAWTKEVLARDAARAGRHLRLIIAEMEDPYRTDPPASGMDPFRRANIWAKWGFGKLDFRYIQPSLGNGKLPVSHLLLLAKPMEKDGTSFSPPATHAAPAQYADPITAPSSLDAGRLEKILLGYMRWAMRIERPEADAQYQSMHYRIARMGKVPLIPLEGYLRRADGRARLDECALAGDDVFVTAMRIYAERVRADKAIRLREEDFMVKLGPARETRAFHLCTVRAATGGTAPMGMACFFTFPKAGFGRCLAFDPENRDPGRLADLVPAIELAMLRDRMGAKGWYIECDPASETAAFERCGFHRLDLDYARPSGLGKGMADTVDLLYKEFGPIREGGQEPPRLDPEAVQDFLARLGREVYGIEHPLGSNWYLVLSGRIRTQWRADAAWSPARSGTAAPQRSKAAANAWPGR